MKSTKSKNAWVLVLLLLTGIVLGSFIGNLAANSSALSWLDFGQSFGFENPIILNLGMLILTFGISIRITIASIIGVVIAIVVYRLI